jgi:hypothetical protein
MEIPKAKNFNTLITTFNLFPFGCLGCLTSGLITDAAFTLIPSFAYQLHYSFTEIMQITILGGCLFHWHLGKLSEITNVTSVLLFIYGAGSMVGPILASYLIESFSIIYLYGFI